MKKNILKFLKFIKQNIAENYNHYFKEFIKDILSSIDYLLKLLAWISLAIIYQLWLEPSITSSELMEFTNQGMGHFSMGGLIIYCGFKFIGDAIHDSSIDYKSIFNITLLSLLIFANYIDFSSIPEIIVQQIYLLMIIYLFKLSFLPPDLNEPCVKWKEEFESDLVKSAVYHEAGHIAVALLLNKLVYGCHICANGNGQMRWKCFLTTNLTTDFVFEKEAIDTVCINYAGKLAEYLFLEDEIQRLGSDMDIASATHALYKLSRHGHGKLGMLDIGIIIPITGQSDLDIAREIGACSALAKKYEVETLKLLEKNKLLVEMIAKQLWKKKHLSQKQILNIYKDYKEGKNNGCKKLT